jgi:HEAT repeat protein
MAVTMKQVRAALDPEEPDYAAAARLGPGALPHLQALVRGDDPMLASKAVYLASLIQDERTPAVVEVAAQHADPVVRVAAASAAQNLGGAAAREVLVELVADPDPGVRKVARAAVPEQPSDALAQRLQEMPDETSDVSEQPRAAQGPLQLDQLMPGEAATPGQMPGEAGGQMPGETQGRMPGERG